MLNFGVSMFPTEYSLMPTELARAVEERGLDSLFFPEHTHIPVERRTPWPGGSELPKHYFHTLDPFVALAASAAVTTRIKLGFGVCLITERDPIVTAKEVASLDLLSNGRVILGAGAGWNREEMENHGTAYPKRWKILRERVLAMKAIWAADGAEFHGEHVDFAPIHSYPKPLQAGGPPVWLGSNSKYITDRVAEYGDGFMPIHGRAGAAALDQLRQSCADRGRDFGTLTLAVFGTPPTDEAVRDYAAQGYRHLIFIVPSAGRDTVLPQLDRLAALAKRSRDLAV